MGYYMRFIVTDQQEVNLSIIENALKAVDTAYALQIEPDASAEYADLLYSGSPYGELEIKRPGETIFSEEMEELQEFIEAAEGERGPVLASLQQATSIVALRVLWQDREAEATLGKIDPLWHWLFENRSGLLQADGEGYYDRTGLILTLILRKN
jgi:hypothetical protein